MDLGTIDEVNPNLYISGCAIFFTTISVETTQNEKTHNQNL